MSIRGAYFITPHAIEKFCERCAPGLSYDRALAAILDELMQHAVSIKPTASGLLQIRVRGGRYCFRARIQTPMEPNQAPVVVTILRSGR